MRVLVSGGSSGIGAAACLRIAEAALARGVQPMIAVCGHKLTTSQQEVVRSIQSMGGTAIALVGDLGDPGVPGQLVEAAVAEFGGLDALVANAGTANPGAICDLSLAGLGQHVRRQPPRRLASRQGKLPPLEAQSRCGLLHLFDVRPAATRRIGRLQPQQGCTDNARPDTRLGMGARRYPGKCGVTGYDPYLDDGEDVRRSSNQEGKGSHHSAGQDRRAHGHRECHRVSLGPLSGYVTGQDICVDGGFSKSILSHIPGRPSSNS